MQQVRGNNKKLDMFSQKIINLYSLLFRTPSKWQRPARITMGCKFLVVSKIKSIETKIKRYFNNTCIRVMYINSSDMKIFAMKYDSCILIHLNINTFLPMMFIIYQKFHSCSIIVLYIEWQKIVCGQNRYKHFHAVHLSKFNNWIF